MSESKISPSDGGYQRSEFGRGNVAAVERMYRFILWLIPVLEAMPRSQKFLLGDRIQTGALDILATLIEAAYTRDRVPLLRRANMGLEQLRYWFRLTKDLKLLNLDRYEHAAREVDDVGRQIGGWLKASRGGGREAQGAGLGPSQDGSAAHAPA